ncbi:MAG: RNA polymerase sigma factor [Acidobacteriaceae bacterium]
MAIHPDLERQIVALRPEVELFCAYLLCRYLGNNQMAPDFAQLTITKGLLGAGSFKNRSKLKTWLFGIAKFTIISHLRSSSRERELTVELEPLIRTETLRLFVEQAPGRNTREDQLIRKIDFAKAFQKARPRYQQVVSLFELGYGLQEIADKLDIPVGTVKSRLFRFRQRLPE